MSAAAQPLTLADQAFERLRKAIVEGEIPAGAKISEPELSRSYGMSRGTLREAIGRLEACSLVQRRANVGARVVTLSYRELIEIYHIREALEGMAARQAAEAMSDGAVEDLQALLVTHRRQMSRDNGQGYFQKEGDLDFHFRIVQGSGNRRLAQLLCDDLYHLVRMYRYQFGMASPRAERAFAEHVRIVEAVADRDGELAEILMRRHVRASRENVEAQLGGGAAE